MTRRVGRRNAPLQEQRWIGGTSALVLEAVDGAWPRLTVSGLADVLERPDLARNTIHKTRETLELRRLVVRQVDGTLDLSPSGRRWLAAFPDCPVTDLERPQARAILRRLRARGEASTVDLAAELGVHRVTTGNWLRRIRDTGGPVVQELRGPLTVWRYVHDEAVIVSAPERSPANAGNAP